MISFTLWGKPVPKGSIRAFPHRFTGRMVALPMGKGYREWERAAVTEAQAACRGKTLKGPVKVSLHFVMPMLKGERAGRWHEVRPDIDKLTRAVLDVLTKAGAFKDDGQVAMLDASKVTGQNPSVLVQIEGVGPFDRWGEIEEAIR